MRFRNINLILAAAVLAAGVGPAMALPNDKIRLENSEYDGGYTGGEFRLYDATDDIPGLYGGKPVDRYNSSPEAITFCLEAGEDFYTGTEYAFEIGLSAVYGGEEPADDEISHQTAYLYEQFVLGTLTGYDYNGSGRDYDAGQLQQVFWFLEGEGGSDASTLATAWVDEANAAVSNGYVNGALGSGKVYVLNPYEVGNPKNVKQSQLIYIVPTPTSVLAGASAMGVLGLAYLFRRRRQQAA